MENEGQQNPDAPKPGQVFSQQPAAPQPAPEPPQPVAPPQAPQADPTPAPTPAEPTETPEPEQSSGFYSETTDDAPEQAGQTVEWTASEFLDHQKPAVWFLGLAIVIVLVAGLVYFLVKSIFSAVMILVIGAVFGVAAKRQPRTLNYGVNSQGVKIGEKYYPYPEFKSFSVTQEGGLSAMVLVPFKRFVPPITIYYEPAQGDEILSVVSNYLPNEENTKDPVEQLMRRVRF